MSDAVLVRSTERTWDIVLAIVVGAVLLLVGVVAFVAKVPALGAVLLIAGLGTMVGGVLVQVRRVRTRRWVRDTGDGFVVIDPDGERACRDADVVSMALMYKRNYSNGELKSVTRRFVAWLVSDQPMPEELPMTTTFASDSSDPLAEMIERISNRLYEQSKTDLQARRPVLGKGWRLENGELVVRTTMEEVHCPLAEITAVDRVDNQLCVWRKGQDVACVKVPMETANVYILGRILDEEVSKRPADSSPPPEGQLGRIIFERAASQQAIVAWQVFGGICLVAGLALLVMGLFNHVLLIFGVIALVLAGLCALGWLYAQKSAFRCHEYGVYQSGMMGERTIRYADVEAFTYSAVRMFYNGAYTGTVFNLNFEPVPGRGGGIAYNTNLPHADDELDNLRDHIAKVIASRMAERLSAGETVDWTPHLRFRPDGLEHEAAGFFGRRKAAVFIPYSQISSFNIEQGYFYLWKHGNPKPVISEEASKRNFYPGFYLFLMRTHLSQEGAAPEGEAPAEAEA